MQKNAILIWDQEVEISGLRQEYPGVLREIDRLFPGLSEQDKLGVAALVTHTCAHCHHGSDRCRCSWDE